MSHVAFWKAAEEHHKDEGRHWHHLHSFSRPFRGRGAGALDVEGIHPKVRVCGNTTLDLNRMWQYLHKEGYKVFGPWDFDAVEIGKSDHYII